MPVYLRTRLTTLKIHFWEALFPVFGNIAKFARNVNFGPRDLLNSVATL